MLKLAVIGAGLMGRRIALVAARADAQVMLFDSQQSALDASAELYRDENVSVTTHSDLTAAIDGADVVIEAIVENLAAKQSLIETISKTLPHAILATNTSALSITAIAENAITPERVVGAHWWNPPDLIPVVEVIRGARTSDAVFERMIEIVASFGKIPVRVEKDVPGFVGNRLQHALWREAIALIEEGVCDAQTVDLMARNTLGLKLGAMGPIENADYVGLDLTHAIHQTIFPALNREPHPAALLEAHIAAGRLGAKSGEGFLEWPQGARERSAAQLSAHVTTALARASSNNPDLISQES